MGLISFIKNLFKQKEDDLWVEPKVNSNNHTIEVNTLTGEIIIKRNTEETYPYKWYSGKLYEIWGN